MMSTQTDYLLKNVASPVKLPHCNAPPAPQMTLEDAALNVMTDFTKTTAFSINQDETIDYALMYMKAVGVRLLFVLDDDCRLVGLITSYDIQEEKPMLYLQSINCNHKTCARTDVIVKNLMTPVNHWKVIGYKDAEKVRISDIVAAFRATGMRHLVVTEDAENAPESVIRGIFSSSRVEQATSLQLEIVSTAKSFAEIEHAMAHS